MARLPLLLLPALALLPSTARAEGEPVGVVSHVQVGSDKVPDVSSLDAWARSFLKPGMSDRDKALAAWRTVVMFQHQDAPPHEFLQHEAVVQDPIKMFNVYGYGFCSMASAHVAALARHAGPKARGWAINAHSVPEVNYDGAWHLLDASLVNYFPKEDGTMASVEEIQAAVREWYERNPGFKGNDAKLRAFHADGGWTGWKRGPALLARSPLLDASGWWPAKTHGWYATMQEYDGTAGAGAKPFLYEYGYSQGYRVNVQLRPGERLTRNWSNKGLHVNMKDGGSPGCLKLKTGEGALVYTPKFGDLAPGRVGNGTVAYDVPLSGSAFRTAVLSADNLEQGAARVRDPDRPGAFVLRVPSSYVYLTGTLTFTTAVGEGGAVVVSFSDNNGLDWKEVARARSSGPHTMDLSPRVLRRYDYRLKFELHGRGTGLDALKLVHDVQHSQRPLPALGQGENTITFSAGPPEGTVTVEGATNLVWKGKQLVYTDFRPRADGLTPDLFVRAGGKGSITFPVAAPGEMVRLRFGTHYRARDARDGIDYEVSFDDSKTWRAAGRAAGPTAGDCKYVTFADVPPGTRSALVRFAATSRNATGIFNLRIDADYREPSGGFRPVKVTYAWEEDGRPCRHVHVARRPQETYTVRCAGRPVMRSLTVELAD